MTQEQFKEIKDRAWDWYCKNMMDWAVETIKDFHNSPKWIKEGVENSLEPDNIQKLLRLSQTRHFELNYTRELEEYYQAKLDENIEAMVGEICDLILVSLNAGGDFNPNFYYPYAKNIKDMMARGLGKEKLEEVVNRARRFLAIPLSEPKKEIDLLALNIVALGYEPYKCLLEKIKELETRTGSWNEKEGKWCKYLGAYTIEEARDKLLMRERIEWFILKYEDDYFWYYGQDDGIDFFENKERAIRKVKKWYKADYSKCKVGGKNA